MRRSLINCMIFLILGIMLAGCAGAPADEAGKLKNDLKDKMESAKEAGDRSSDETDKPEKSSKGKRAGTEFDLGTNEDIQSFLAGEWTLLDRSSGEDFAVMTVEEDGKFKFERLPDSATGTGTIWFDYMTAYEDEEPDMFYMEFDSIKDLVPRGDELYADTQDSDETSGIFHIGCFEEEDYLYLKEIGNGDSAISMYVLNVDGAPDGIVQWKNDWLFYRDNGGRSEVSRPDDDTFYAWAWEIDDDGEGVWLQPMNENEYETVDDYSNRNFLGGYFNETEDLGVAYYAFADDADLSGIFMRKEWDSGYPLMMCEVELDDDGDIESLIDVDMALYNVYDLGPVEPEYSYEGTVFTINGVDIDVRDQVPAITAIMDCKRVGDWIIIECHINPHTSAYEFYNINDGNISYFQYEIVGTSLTWQGDDLSTAVYARDDQVFDFWGHCIGSIGEGEIYDLKIINGTTVEATCLAVDDTGREKEFVEKFEYEPCDRAVLSYYEYLLGNSRQWREFVAGAPANASALVIVDPPEKLLERMPWPIDYEEGALDKVAVVSLTDGQEVYIEPKEPGAAGSNKRSI